VTITGTGVSGTTSVTFGGVPASFTVISPTQIEATTPAGSGTVDVVVTTAGGSATVTDGYTYVAPPTINAVSPNVGPEAGGNTVTVTGTNLTTTIDVSFGGAPAPSFIVDSATQITVTAPAGVGTADVTVTTFGGSATATGAYTYVPAPAIFALTPDNGPDTGGTPVTITGIAFTTTTSVTIDGIEVPFTVVDDIQITFTTPAHIPGPVDVTVTTAAGSATAVEGFLYTSGV
jgi:hypothetical protein